MIKNLSIILVLLGLCITALSQSVYTVSNDSKFNANFTDLQTAHNTVPVGSTLYLLPSQKSYGDLVMTKRLNIYGTGFLLNENFQPNSQAAGGTTIVSAFVFKQGSSGSLIEGVELTESGTYGGSLPTTSYGYGLARFVFDSASNITISRCYARTAETGNAICSMDSASNCLIKQCYFSVGVGYCPTVNGGTGGNNNRFVLLNVRWLNDYKIKNVTFSNNIITAAAHCGTNMPYYLSFPAITVSSRVSNLKFINNTIVGETSELYNGNAGEPGLGFNPPYMSNRFCTSVEYTNNIMQNGSGPKRFFAFGSSHFFGPTTNNIATDTGFFAGTAGTNAAQVANVLQIYYPNGNSTLDGSNMIQPNHMALTYASGGGQIGAFGGQYPFKLSGIPDYPYPYSVKVADKATTGGTLSVKIKAKAGNN